MIHAENGWLVLQFAAPPTPHIQGTPPPQPWRTMRDAATHALEPALGQREEPVRPKGQSLGHQVPSRRKRLADPAEQT